MQLSNAVTCGHCLNTASRKSRSGESCWLSTILSAANKNGPIEAIKLFLVIMLNNTKIVDSSLRYTLSGGPTTVKTVASNIGEYAIDRNHKDRLVLILQYFMSYIRKFFILISLDYIVL